MKAPNGARRVTLPVSTWSASRRSATSCHGSPDTWRMDSEMRGPLRESLPPLPSSAPEMPSTFTRTLSPTLTASSACCTRDHDSSETCTMPSRPGAISTNAPNGARRATVPSSTSPSFTLCIRALSDSACSRSSSMRRETTMLRPFCSSRVTRNWKVWPVKESGSAPGRRSIWLAGQKARRFSTSTLKPPLQGPVTRPSTGMPPERASSSWARPAWPVMARESLISLALAETTYSSSTSPTARGRLPSASSSSLRSTMPSTLAPVATKTVSSPMATTVAFTRSPVRTVSAVPECASSRSAKLAFSSNASSPLMSTGAASCGAGAAAASWAGASACAVSGVASGVSSPVPSVRSPVISPISLKSGVRRVAFTRNISAEGRGQVRRRGCVAVRGVR